MRRLLLLVLLFSISFSTCSFAASEYYCLWDIPMTLDTDTYVAMMYEKKLIKMEIEKGPEKEHYRFVAKSDSSDNLELYGSPASITLYQLYHKQYDPNPYYADVIVTFDSMTKYLYDNYMVDAQSLTDAVYSGLVNKYGMPSSLMIEYNNDYYSHYGEMPEEFETKELANEFYSTNSIDLWGITESWAYPKDTMCFRVQAIFSNIEFLVISDWSAIYCEVIFHNEPVKPWKTDRKELVFPTQPPHYEDSGF